MKDKPGYSWGPDLPVNALRTSRGWLLIDYAEPPPLIVGRVSTRRGRWCWLDVMTIGALLNYGDVGPTKAIRALLDSEA